jgi:putative zinc finger protein
MTKSFDELLRAALKAPVPEPPDGCLDAGVFAAWFEGTLDSAERAAAEAHAAGCSRCQAVLAAMIRIEPPMESRPWWRSPAFGWLVPITVAAAALVVYVQMEGDPRVLQVAMAPAGAPPSPSATRQAAAADSGEKAERDALVPSSAADSRASARAIPKETARLESLAKSREELQERARMSEPSAAATAAELQQLKDRFASVDETAPQKTAPSQPAAATAPPATAPAPPAAAAAPAPASAPAPAPEKPSEPGVVVTATEERARADAAARKNLAESVIVSVAGASAGFRQGQVVVQTADGSTRWRSVTPGSVQRSIDAGATWETQSTGVAAIVSSGAAPSKSVCWLVGKGGVVLLSSDGRSWRHVPFPEAVDLVSVAAADASSAAVTTVNGRTFTTVDGGKSWK